MIGNNNMWHL